jgi:hypothetical protein
MCMLRTDRVVGLGALADWQAVNPPVTSLPEILPPGPGMIDERLAFRALVMRQLELSISRQTPAGPY